MKNFFALLITVCFLCGCSTIAGNKKLETSQNGVEKQMVGLTTKSEIRKKFGTPNLIFEKENLEYYEYKNVSGHGRYFWLVPVLGWIASFMQDNYTYTETNLFVGFNKADEIEKWNVIQTSGTFD